MARLPRPLLLAAAAAALFGPARAGTGAGGGAAQRPLGPQPVIGRLRDGLEEPVAAQDLERALGPLGIVHPTDKGSRRVQGSGNLSIISVLDHPWKSATMSRSLQESLTHEAVGTHQDVVPPVHQADAGINPATWLSANEKIFQLQEVNVTMSNFSEENGTTSQEVPSYWEEGNASKANFSNNTDTEVPSEWENETTTTPGLPPPWQERNFTSGNFSNGSVPEFPTPWEEENVTENGTYSEENWTIPMNESEMNETNLTNESDFDDNNPGTRLPPRWHKEHGPNGTAWTWIPTWDENYTNTTTSDARLLTTTTLDTTATTSGDAHSCAGNGDCLPGEVCWDIQADAALANGAACPKSDVCVCDTLQNTTTTMTTTVSVTSTTSTSSRTSSSSTSSSTTSSSTTVTSTSTTVTSKTSSTTTTATTTTSTTSTTTRTTTTRTPRLGTCWPPVVGPHQEAIDCWDKSLDGTCTVTCMFPWSGSSVYTCQRQGRELRMTGQSPVCTSTTTTTTTPRRCLTNLPQGYGVTSLGCYGTIAGSTCWVGCGWGYQGTSQQYYCNYDGVLQGTIPVCSKRKCRSGIPAELDASACANKEYGDYCLVTCGAGYKVSSKAWRCDGDGVFRGEAPTCIKLLCDPNTLPSGVGVNSTACNGGRYGDVCQVGCNSGFTGTAVNVTCQSDGTFSSASVTCRPAPCNIPPSLISPSPATSTCAGVVTDQNCLAFCGAGYGGSAADRHCQAPTLLGNTPNCTGNQCTMGLPWGSGLNTSNCTGVTTLQTCTPTCQPGYRATAPAAPLTCRTSGAFTASNLTCARAPCQALAGNYTAAAVTTTCAGLVYGESCAAACGSGYRLVGSPQYLVCGVTGNFLTRSGSVASNAPTCRPKPCLSNLPTRRVNSNCSGATTGQTCVATPKNGYRVASNQTGSPIVTCLTTGAFSTLTLQVVPMTCKAPTFATGVGHSCTDKSFQQGCWTYCKKGFTGSPVRYTCGWNGTGVSLTPDGGSGISCSTSSAKAFVADFEVRGMATCNLTALAAVRGTKNNCDTSPDACVIECRSGYNITGNITVYSCTSDSKISGPTAPNCTAVECTSGFPDGLGVAHNCDGVVTDGTCQANCSMGYRLANGSAGELFTCTSTGELNGTSPSCEALPCGTLVLASVYNGANCAGKRTGDTCLVDCAAGYTNTDGAAMYTCEPNSSFVGSLPTCVPNKCNSGVPSGLDLKVDAACNNLTTGQTCAIACADGYNGTAATFTCSATGSLTGDRPTCTLKTCSNSVPAVLGLVNNCDGVTFGRSCQVGCGDGYKLRTGASVQSWTCTWNAAKQIVELQGNSTNLCEPLPCQYSLPVGPTFVHNCAGVGTDSSCIVRCAPGYEAPPSTLFCQSDRNLTGTKPSCVLKTCPNRVVTGVDPTGCAGTKYGANCTTFCKAGYTAANGTAELQELACLVDPANSSAVSLQGPNLTCVANTCTFGLPVDPGVNTSNCVGLGTDGTCTVPCAEGYTGQSRTFTCLSSGGFSGTAPTCSAVASTTSTTMQSVPSTAGPSASTQMLTSTSAGASTTAMTTALTTRLPSPATSTVATSTMLTTRTTTAMTGTLITGTFHLTMTDADRYVNDARVVAAVAESLGKLVGVPADYIAVKLSIVVARRLSSEDVEPLQTSAPRRMAANTVRADYTISLPSNAPSTVNTDTSKITAALTSSTAVADLTSSIQTSLTSTLGSDAPTVEVTSIATPSIQVIGQGTTTATPSTSVGPEEQPRGSGGGGGGGGGGAAVAVGVVIPLILLIVCGLVGFWWWRRRQKDTGGIPGRERVEDFSLGQSVEVRSHLHEVWQTGIVTCVEPLRVRLDIWDPNAEGVAWKFVQQAGAVHSQHSEVGANPLEDVRVDPEDGKKRTWRELKEHYKGQYTDEELKEYWENECVAVRGRRASGIERPAMAMSDRRTSLSSLDGDKSIVVGSGARGSRDPAPGGRRPAEDQRGSMQTASASTAGPSNTLANRAAELVSGVLGGWRTRDGESVGLLGAAASSTNSERPSPRSPTSGTRGGAAAAASSMSSSAASSSSDRAPAAAPAPRLPAQPGVGKLATSAGQRWPAMEEEEDCSLIVNIVSARGLRQADWGVLGSSDPYVVCQISNRPETKVETETIDNNLNPVWNFKAEMHPYIKGQSLEFFVWDDDYFKEDDFLGKAFLGPAEIEAGFEGELALTGDLAQGYLYVKVSLSGRPPTTGRSGPSMESRGSTSSRRSRGWKAPEAPNDPVRVSTSLQDPAADLNLGTSESGSPSGSPSGRKSRGWQPAAGGTHGSTASSSSQHRSPSPGSAEADLRRSLGHPPLPPPPEGPASPTAHSQGDGSEADRTRMQLAAEQPYLEMAPEGTRVANPEGAVAGSHHNRPKKRSAAAGGSSKAKRSEHAASAGAPTDTGASASASASSQRSRSPDGAVAASLAVPHPGASARLALPSGAAAQGSHSSSSGAHAAGPGLKLSSAREPGRAGGAPSLKKRSAPHSPAAPGTRGGAAAGTGRGGEAKVKRSAPPGAGAAQDSPASSSMVPSGSAGPHLALPVPKGQTKKASQQSAASSAASSAAGPGPEDGPRVPSDGSSGVRRSQRGWTSVAKGQGKKASSAHDAAVGMDDIQMNEEEAMASGVHPAGGGRHGAWPPPKPSAVGAGDASSSGSHRPAQGDDDAHHGKEGEEAAMATE